MALPSASTSSCRSDFDQTSTSTLRKHVLSSPRFGSFIAVNNREGHRLVQDYWDLPQKTGKHERGAFVTDQRWYWFSADAPAGFEDSPASGLPLLFRQQAPARGPVLRLQLLAPAEGIVQVAEVPIPQDVVVV